MEDFEQASYEAMLVYLTTRRSANLGEVGTELGLPRGAVLALVAEGLRRNEIVEIEPEVITKAGAD